MADQRATDIHDGELKPVEPVKADPEVLLAEAIEIPPVDGSAPDLQMIHMGGRVAAEDEVASPTERAQPEAVEPTGTGDGAAVLPQETSGAGEPAPQLQTPPAAEATEDGTAFADLATDGDEGSSNIGVARFMGPHGARGRTRCADAGRGTRA